MKDTKEKLSPLSVALHWTVGIFVIAMLDFCKEVFNELPMEFAVEAQKLLGISLDGAVG